MIFFTSRCRTTSSHEPATCAPHGLVIGENCLSYSSYDDLMRQIGGLSPKQEQELREGGLAWVRGHSCEALAARVVAAAKL